MVGKFIGIGVGPGDPELITIKAVKALQTADIICIPKANIDKPSLAVTMIQSILEERRVKPEMWELIFPMTKDDISNQELWDKNANLIAQKVSMDKTVVFITLGDPMFYSTFIYLYQSLQENHPNVILEITPGVSAFNACATSARIPLAEKEELITVIPSELDEKLVEQAAKCSENLVFIKCAYRLKELAPVLKRAGFKDNSIIAIVRRCSMPNETVTVGKLCDVLNWNVNEDYFTIAIVKKKYIINNKGNVVRSDE
ncbi:MAG: precorrin-2 C(20)-methyltransferase [Nitrososphaerota archaeon]|jgi:precorrin-2/cobalt-factor-2 C20-methyltransferase|uniref:precorrin-2 C(20)-methyltransferase n=1 Tax=Candidatus Bathycorpusculum sp. TaxID=2994959 RepID=UPI00281C83F5|nr:precorrin-2 C(20)-methyltransferase [Candidatus Termiticorpusculum sp.]MCL2257018.1 precorrin-2 C(20)-methyltransferase [Candidatus Termiticorpusculum sp.]MCL2292857.1 precorrin-2 C(20)-methyltransferase [Candidatus Termiticorpusculum sp.]MDR0460366.1 precorrin-2 C(20)-methyltransferase [Nitrososphaerota archaeon]